MNYQETLRRLLEVVVDKSASDLFITTNFPPALKLNGQLHMLGSQRLTEHDVSQFAETMTTEPQRDAFSQFHELTLPTRLRTRAGFASTSCCKKGAARS